MTTATAAAASKKRPAAASSMPSVVRRRFLWIGLQLVISFAVFICILSLLRIQSESESESESRFQTLSVALPSSYSSASPADDQAFVGIPKIAFLFLARSGLNLDFLWNSFFQNADVENFSIYVHSRPGFVFDSTTTRSGFFYGRQLRSSVQVVWGECSMIEAERMLFSAALDDPANQRFVLVSDSCVPLYNFTYMYNYLMSSSKSFVDSFLDVKEGRYNPNMSPIIPRDKWRKGSQWIALVRKHAKIVVADNAIFPVFRRYCKRRPVPDLKRKRNKIHIIEKEKEHDCIPDEHYLPTLLSMNGLEDELERRTLTYTFWNHSKSETDKESWHPMMFEYANASPQRISEIKKVNHVYYETEYRTEWCQVNATLVPCFLFARKFSLGAAMRLLSEGFVGPFDASALLLNSS